MNNGIMEQTMEQAESLNVFSEPLESCSTDPVTGFFRDGCCNTNTQDVGSHTVCVALTLEFLEYSRSRGNDLMTPVPQFGFPGLSEGQRWCLCASRWLEAHKAGKAPRVYLRRTHLRALDTVPMETLREYAIDLS
ncbi:DUF2237 family protein [Congregibacter sp.]|uniref:DUF2237 family protein n=1 Tax=Congregibacter sp. TaxID=2744308 RepID=UPI003F6DA214